MCGNLYFFLKYIFQPVAALQLGGVTVCQRFYLMSNRVFFANLRTSPPVSVSQQQDLFH